MPTDLWGFAVELYARPGVEAASLELQAAGADVCVLLCAAWLGSKGVAWRQESVAQLHALARPWQHEVVAPLRHLRQQWRTAAQADPELARLREQVKGLELEAERQLLARLEALAGRWPAVAAQDLQQWLEQALPAQARGQQGALKQLRASLEST